MPSLLKHLRKDRAPGADAHLHHYQAKIRLDCVGTNSHTLRHLFAAEPLRYANQCLRLPPGQIEPVCNGIDNLDRGRVPLQEQRQQI